MESAASLDVMRLAACPFDTSLFDAAKVQAACALTSNLHRAHEPANVLLDHGEGNLPKQSVVLVSQISAVDMARFGERIGSLSEARVQQILAGIAVPASVVLRALAQR